jgi:hypothetical protein
MLRWTVVGFGVLFVSVLIGLFAGAIRIPPVGILGWMIGDATLTEQQRAILAQRARQRKQHRRVVQYHDRGLRAGGMDRDDALEQRRVPRMRRGRLCTRNGRRDGSCARAWQRGQARARSRCEQQQRRLPALE